MTPEKDSPPTPRTPEELRAPAAAKEEENKAFRDYLKSGDLEPERLDAMVHKLFRESTIDCTACGECCRALYVSLSEEDIPPLALALHLDADEFKEEFLTFTDEEKPWIFRQRACPFQTGNLCTVYAVRPSVCREFPHLHKPGFSERLHSVITSARNCPIVFEIIERMKILTGFRPSAP